MYQKLIIVGRLGKDPEMRYTQGAEPVTTLSVAVDTSKGETIWFRVSVWKKQAEPCNQYLKKGSRVLVEGALKADAQGNPRVYERKDGGWASSYEVTADKVRFLSGNGEAESAPDEVPF